MAGKSESKHSLSTEIAADLVAVVTDVLKRSSAPMAEFVERFDLSFSQLKVMFTLATTDSPLAIGAVAEAVSASLPATGRAVDGLVRHGLVTRTEDPDDRRVKRVAITELGVEGMNQIYQSRVSTLAAVLAHLSADELVALSAALGPIKQVVGDGPGKDKS